MSVDVTPAVASVILLAVGLVLLAWGHRVARLSMGLAGLLIGGYLGQRLGLAVGAAGWTLVGCTAGGALLLAMLTPLVRRAGLFVLGFGAGSALAALVVGPPEGTTSVALAAAAGLAGGVAGVFMERPLLAVATSYLGAVATVAGFGGLTGLGPGPDHLLGTGGAADPRALPWSVAVPVLALWIAGSIHQLTATRRRRRNRGDD